MGLSPRDMAGEGAARMDEASAASAPLRLTGPSGQAVLPPEQDEETTGLPEVIAMDRAPTDDTATEDVVGSDGTDATGVADS
jgi:hypothetical protein